MGTERSINKICEAMRSEILHIGTSKFDDAIFFNKISPDIEFHVKASIFNKKNSNSRCITHLKVNSTKLLGVVLALFCEVRRSANLEMQINKFERSFDLAFPDEDLKSQYLSVKNGLYSLVDEKERDINSLRKKINEIESELRQCQHRYQEKMRLS
jgi:hypothetical protein